MKNHWHVYILRCIDGSLYTGITRDVKARLERHNEARGARFTRGRGPVRLIYSEECAGKSSALKREAEIKKWSRSGKERLVKYGTSNLPRR